MNFVFFSPHFPTNSTDFCDRLKKAGAIVLGIGDAPYEALNARLTGALAEYYRVNDMEDEDQTLRALGHFIHRWGRIGRFESLNEHWLELEAQMRTDFNIFGTKLDFVRNLKSKSRMRAFFRKSGVATVPQHHVTEPRGSAAVPEARRLPGCRQARHRRRRLHDLQDQQSSGAGQILRRKAGRHELRHGGFRRRAGRHL